MGRIGIRGFTETHLSISVFIRSKKYNATADTRGWKRMGRIGIRGFTETHLSISVFIRSKKYNATADTRGWKRMETDGNG
jgi:hypothetical protein